MIMIMGLVAIVVQVGEPQLPMAGRGGRARGGSAAGQRRSMRMVSDLTISEQNQELHELRAALHGMVEVASRERLLVGRAVFTAREQPAPVRMLPRQVAFYGGQSTVGMPFYIQDFVVTTAGGMSVYVRPDKELEDALQKPKALVKYTVADFAETQ